MKQSQEAVPLYPFKHIVMVTFKNSSPLFTTVHTNTLPGNELSCE